MFHNPNFIFNKVAASTKTQDFVGGLDPFGNFTSEYGRQNQQDGLSEKEHSKRKAISTAGGVVGGGLVVPAATSGILGGVKGYSSAKGGVKAKAVGAAKGVAEGAVDPFAALVKGRRAVKALKRISRSGGTLNGKERRAAEFIAHKTPLGGLAKGNKGSKNEAINLMQQVSEAKNGNLTAQRDIATKALPVAKQGYGRFVSALGLSGAVGAAGANAQYGKGRKMEKDFQARMKKTANSGLSREEVLSLLQEQKQRDEDQSAAQQQTRSGVRRVVGGGAMYGTAAGAGAVMKRKLPHVKANASQIGQEFVDSTGKAIKSGSGTEFVKAYTGKGAPLIGENVMTVGKKGFTGKDVVQGVRDGKMGDVIENLGFGRKWGEGSEAHYDAFSKGSGRAFQRMAEENEMPNLRSGMQQDLLGARFEAAQRANRNGVIHPTRLRMEYAKVLQEKMGLDPNEAKSFARSIDAQMLNSNPQAYKQHLQLMGQGKFDEAGKLQDGLLDAAVGGKQRINKTFGEGLGGSISRSARQMRQVESAGVAPADLGKGVQNTVINNLHRNGRATDNLIQRYSANKLTPNFKQHVPSYGQIVQPLQKYRRIQQRTIATGKGMKAVGAGIAGLGAAKAVRGLNKQREIENRPSIQSSLKQRFMNKNE